MTSKGTYEKENVNFKKWRAETDAVKNLPQTHQSITPTLYVIALGNGFL
jgi:hypothetical protein